MVSKENVLNLIDHGEFVDVFVELNKYFVNRDERLNELSNELINPPGNFSQANYTTRLKLFVSLHYKPSKVRSNTDIDYYDLLCAIDFKLQTENFQRIYPNRNIVSFLLHSESTDQEEDVKWLCKQLLYKESLNSDLVIDLGSVAGGSYETLLREFYIKFDVNEAPAFKTKPLVQLRSRIEEKLQNDHLVCIVKGPEKILGIETELGSFFDELLSFLDDNIDKEKCNHSLIFIFIDDGQHRFPHKYSEYFLSFSEQDELNYFKRALDPDDLSIIDLAPIGKVVESDISTWIGHGMKKGIDVYHKISCYHGRENDILKHGNSPYQVIRKICADLNVTIQDKWKI